MQLFTRHFSFESKLAPADYAAALQSFESLYNQFWLADMMVVEIGAPTASATPFTITMTKVPERLNFYILSRVKGEIIVDPLSTQTVVQGIAAFFVPIRALSLFITMILTLVYGLLGAWVLTIFGGAVIALMIVGPFVDRAILINLIGNTAKPGPKRHRNKSKMKQK